VQYLDSVIPLAVFFSLRVYDKDTTIVSVVFEKYGQDSHARNYFVFGDISSGACWLLKTRNRRSVTCHRRGPLTLNITAHRRST